MRSYFITLLSLCAIAVVGCADDEMMPGDAATDTGAADGSRDAETDAGVLSCTFPALRIAGTPETDALASSPAKCGAPAYSWSTDAELGTVRRTGFTRPFLLALVTALFESEGVVLPEPPTHTVAMQQYAYVTQDRGALVEATALVTFPTDLSPDDGPRDVILFLHGTSGFANACGVSESLAYQGLAAFFSGYGYTTVMPDYLGLGFLETETDEPHAYLVGEAVALAALDAVRAAADLDPSQRGNTCMAPRVLVYGASQGGHAALWTERIAPYYAPELEIVGAVATVPPSALIDQSERAFLTLVSATGNLTAALTLMAPWYGYEDRLDEVFVAPWDADLPGHLLSACDVGASDLPATLEALLQPAISSAAAAGTLADVEPWGCMLAENDLVQTSVPRLDAYGDGYGVLFITGEADTLVHTPIERDGYAALCGAGMPVQYLECEGAEHGPATFWSLPETLDFMAARFRGDAFDGGACPAAGPSRCAGTPVAMP